MSMAEQEEIFDPQVQQVEYNDDNIRHMDDMEHIRTRPGMYIGKLGDGSAAALPPMTEYTCCLRRS